MKKYTVMLGSGILLIGLVVGGAIFNQSRATDVPPLVQEVQHQGEVLDNHEARITNNENNIKDLQNKTSTSPSTSNVTPPPVTTQSVPPSQLATTTNTSTPPPPPPTITIQSYEKVPDGDSTNCTYHYSDGTSYTFQWIKVVKAGSETYTTTHSFCDDSIIGQQKAN